MYIGTYVPIILDEIESETGKNHPKKHIFSNVVKMQPKNDGYLFNKITTQGLKIDPMAKIRPIWSPCLPWQ
jgi:hypothetical protein